MTRPPGWLWALVALAFLIPGRPLWALVYLAGGLWLAVSLALSWGLRRLQVERVLQDDRLFAGETLPVVLRFRNPTGAPISWLQYLESRPVELAAQPLSGICTLEAGETAEVRYVIYARRRGRYAIGPLRWTAGDPFGLFRVQGELANLTPFVVYPRVVPLPELGLPAQLPMGDLATRARLFEDPAWIAGARPYQPGDPMRRIHWAATARTGQLASRQYRHAVLLPACVCLNLNREDYDHFATQAELAVTAAASLAHYLVERRQQVALLATGVDPDAAGADAAARAAVPAEEAAGPAGAETASARPEAQSVFLPLRQGDMAVGAILEVLARIEGASGQDFARAVAEHARLLPRGTLLCLVTPRETPALAALCARLPREGRPVLLFVLDGASGARDGYHVWRLSEIRPGEVVVG